MKVTEAIESLDKILKGNGDLEVYLEVNEEVPCSECGESKSRTYDGFCRRISTINLSNKKCAWLLADRL